MRKTDSTYNNSTMKKSFLHILYIFLFIIAFPLVSFSQNYVLSGLVIDQSNNKHLPFVKIVFNNHGGNTFSDLNGMYTIHSTEPILEMSIHHEGYLPLRLDVSKTSSPLIIPLIPSKTPSDSLARSKSDLSHLIDSINLNQQKQQLIQTQQSLLSGEIKVSWFSFDMNKMKRYNQFEGIYLGLGGHTNEKLSRLISLGGFWGYGFKDKKTKYGFDVSIWPDKEKLVTLKADYTFDVRESAGVKFFDEKTGTLEPSSFRYFYINKMDYEDRQSLSVNVRQGNSAYFFSLQRDIIDRGYDINNGVKVLIPDHYNVSGMTAGFRLAPFGKDVTTDGKGINKNQLYPVLWFQLTQGIPGLFKGQYDFTRYEGKFRLTDNFGKPGKSILQIDACLLRGDAPYFEFFNGHGSFGNFGLYATGSFATMHPDEFLNNKSLDIFYTHCFGNIFHHTLLSNPAPALVFNYGWGKLDKNPPFYFLPTEDLHKGYLETGIQINSLLDFNIYSLGMGVYYRMGAYSYPTIKENLVYKIVVTIP